MMLGHVTVIITVIIIPTLSDKYLFSRIISLSS